MYAKIMKDHLFDPVATLTDDLGLTDRTGVVLFGGPSEREDPLLLDVRLLDDDRILYFECLADDESLERLADWAARDSGCTILQTKDANGTWQDTIS